MSAERRAALRYKCLTQCSIYNLHNFAPLNQGHVRLYCLGRAPADFAKQTDTDAAVTLQGVNGWHLHPEVKAYSYYDAGDPSHEPETFILDAANAFTAHTELVRLGMAHL